LQAATESLQHRLRGQQPDARGRQLDTEGKAVESLADLDDRVFVVVG
jgi:hypothetical protein